MASPPASSGAVNSTDTWPFDGVTEMTVGADGWVRGVPVAVLEAGPSPAALIARTATVYSVPLTSGSPSEVVVMSAVKGSSGVPAPVVGSTSHVSPPVVYS